MSSAAKSSPRILVTGFGPFPGVPSNVSELLVTALKEAGAGPGLDLHIATIPVVWSDARAALREAIANAKPDAILHFGVAKRLTGFEVETRAVNLSGPKEDHAGVTRPAKPLMRPGPLYRYSTLPPGHLIRALRRNGFAVQRSNDAGRYLCNATLYWTLTETEGSDTLAGFVHMPALGVATGAGHRLTFDASVKAARILVRAVAEAVQLKRRVT
jgi:pyroglutamyl-peptidase